jgi:hypothetical protein
MVHKPSEVFAVLLKQLGDRPFRVKDIVKLHKVFWELREKNPKFMEGFEFRKYTNPECITLKNLIRDFRLAGVLYWHNFCAGEYAVDSDRLNKILPPDIRAYTDFQDIDTLAKL